MPTYLALKEELVNALDRHIDLLKDTATIDPDSLDGVMFMMRSFGFIFDRAPQVLLTDDPEEMNFLMFQYYSLLHELKYNLLLNYSYSKIHQRTLLSIVQDFPTTYETDMRQWWESLTGLQVDETKQTICVKDL